MRGRTAVGGFGREEMSILLCARFAGDTAWDSDGVALPFSLLADCTARNRRKEMEMLSNQKRGWQGRSGGVMPPASKSGSNGRRKGSSTKTRNRAAGAIGGSSKNGPLHAPQDHFQFQQDWRRRCLTDSERRAYLSLIGPEKLAVLFRVEMEPDMLEQVLSLVCGGLTPGNQAGELDAVTPSASTDPAGSIDAGGDSTRRQGSREEAARSCVDWLWALTRTGRFEINIQFLDRAEKRAIARVFDLIAETFGNSSCGLDPERLDSLRKAYAA